MCTPAFLFHNRAFTDGNWDEVIYDLDHQAYAELRETYAQTNAYICKNLFWFKMERYAGFGEKGEFLWLVPQGFSVKNNLIANAEYRLRNLPDAYADFRKIWEERRKQAQDREEYPYTTIDAMTVKPGKQLVD